MTQVGRMVFVTSELPFVNVTFSPELNVALTGDTTRALPVPVRVRLPAANVVVPVPLASELSMTRFDVPTRLVFVPVIVKSPTAVVVEVEMPESCRAAPLRVIGPELNGEPEAWAVPVIFPALTVVPPLYVLAPVSDSVPLPVFVRPTVPAIRAAIVPATP